MKRIGATEKCYFFGTQRRMPAPKERFSFVPRQKKLGKIEDRGLALE